MKKVTIHGKKRIKQRVENYKKENSLLTIVSKNGYTPDYFYGNFYDYLYRKSLRGAKIKVYKEKIYILSKNSNKLITVYPVPKKFLPVENYKYDIDYIENLKNLRIFKFNPICIELKENINQNKQFITGFIENFITINGKITTVSIKNHTRSIIVDIDNIKRISLNENYFDKYIAEEMGIT